MKKRSFLKKTFVCSLLSILIICFFLYYNYYYNTKLLFLSQRKLHLGNEYEIKSTKILWHDPSCNIFFSLDTNYNKKHNPSQILKIIFEEWRAMVMRYTDNGLIFKINHAACGNQSLVINISFDREWFISATSEYIFIKNLWDTIRCVFPYFQELYIFNEHNPLNFRFLGHYYSAAMQDSIENLLHDKLNGNNELIWNNKVAFVAFMSSVKGNKIGDIYEKNIYQKANIYKKVFIIPDSLPHSNSYYADVLQKIRDKNKKELCFVSFFKSEYPIVSIFIPDNEEFINGVHVPSIISNKSTRNVSDNMIIIYRLLKEYCEKNNIPLLASPARHKACYSYTLAPSIAIEVGVPNSKDPIINDILQLINSLIDKE